MKTILFKHLAFTILFVLLSFIASAQLYVKQRPAIPFVFNTPDINEQGYLLIEEEWAKEDGQYRFDGCRWVKMRKGYVWKPGYWKRHRKHGETWVNGRWVCGK
jgi:hypothetical protein